MKKAAKGRAQTINFWGNEPDASYAWYGGDYDLGHHPVGKKNQIFSDYLILREMFGSGLQLLLMKKGSILTKNQLNGY